MNEAVLQCFLCGKQIDEGDDYSDVAITRGNCPEHEDYLDWSPQFEEYLCSECGQKLAGFFKIKELPTV